LGLLLATSAPAAGQTLIQYDGVAADTQAVVTCGFCATEKFGVMFYELPGGGGLPPSAFPFTLENVQIAVAATQVTGEILSGETYTCSGLTTGGRVDATLEVYAGTQVPATIANLPGSGAWPGEIVVVPAGTVQLELSTDSAPGANSFNVMMNSLQVGATVPSPNTYLRVVVGIPSGSSSTACRDLGFQPPALSPFRDDNGRVASLRSFIYQLGFLGSSNRWTWVEDVTDPVTMQRGINGDWLIRLNINPMGTVNPDAGVAEDSGPSVVDTGVLPDAAAPSDSGVEAPDAGEPANTDSGVAPAGPPTITDISPDSTDEGTAANVMVVGTGFQEGLTLKIGAISAEVRLLSGSTTIVADVPMGIAAGVYDVIVTNPDGQSAILSDGFTVRGDDPGTPVAKEGCTSAGAGTGGLWLLLGLGLIRRRR